MINLYDQFRCTITRHSISIESCYYISRRNYPNLRTSSRKGGAILQTPELVTSWHPYLPQAERRFYRQKEEIYRENDRGEKGCYYLQKGLIKISTTIHTGESCIVDIVSDDHLFGEQAADGDMYFSTASVMEDSIVYYFRYETIEAIMREDSQFSMLFFRSLTEKLETLSNNLLFHSLPSEKILARTLLLLREKFVSERIPFTQTELCHYTNLNRITVYKILKRWDMQIVSIENKKILIHDQKALEDIAVI